MDVIFRQNEQGRITGATFIDHTAGIVFNGSRLGKEYSANKFQELFTVPASVGEKVHPEPGPEHGHAGRQKNDLRPEQQQERKDGERPERQAESAPETHEQDWRLRRRGKVSGLRTAIRGPTEKEEKAGTEVVKDHRSLFSNMDS